MKKLWLTSLILIHCGLMKGQEITFAQHALHAGYGMISDMRIFFESENFLGTVSTSLYADVKGTGTFIAGYTRYFSEHISVGAELSYQYLQINGEYFSGEPINNFYSFGNLLLRFDYRYVNHESFQVYSGGGIGPAFIAGKWVSSEGEQPDYFAPFITYQFNIIGMRVGNDWAGYGELGFGRNGLLNVGVSRRF